MRTRSQAAVRSKAFRLSPLAASVALACTPALAIPYQVTNTGDSGTGTLRQAILDANADCASNLNLAPAITFAIAGPGPFTISPATSLPVFQCANSGYTPSIDGVGQITVDGSIASAAPTAIVGIEAIKPAVLTITGMTISGWSATTFPGNYGVAGPVQLYSSTISGNYIGVFADSGSVIGDGTASGRNIIGGNGNQGISVPNGNVTIHGNYIGTDGVMAMGQNTGIGVSGPGSAINNNVISGNSSGIVISSASNVSITGNLIGLDVSGTSAMGNGFAGIFMSGSTGISIAGNRISGNGRGLKIMNADSTFVLSSNYIGTNAAGTSAVGNLLFGVDLECASGGGLATIASNTISGNGSNGLEIRGSSGLRVSGNNIGTSFDGVNALPNTGFGVFIGDGSCSNPTGNVLSNNFIAANSTVGVELATGSGNTLTQNSIAGNGVKNVDINSNYPYGALPNDPGDGDAGPNNQQNYPIINSVTQSSTDTTISFTLDSTPGRIFHIEIFDNRATDGGGTARTYRGDTFLTAGAGPTPGSFTLGALTDHISLTATDTTTGDTSEISPIANVVFSPAVAVTPTTLDFGNVVLGTTSAAMTSTLLSNGAVDYAIRTFDSSPACYGGSFCGGGFICTTDCSTSSTYKPNSSCSVTATFSPTFVGFDSATIYVCDNTLTSPQAITLTGQGVTPPPLEAGPNPWDFGDVLVGATSAPQRFGFLNNGPTSIGILPPVTQGPFNILFTDCGSVIGPGSSCTATVEFAPTQGGPATGLLAVIQSSQPLSAPGPKFTLIPAALVDLSGNGVTEAQLTAPDFVNFGAYTLGNSPVTQVVTFTNSGNALLTFSSMSAPSPFGVINNCPTNLNPGDSCTAVVSFSSTTDGTFTGNLTVVTNAAGGSRSIPLNAVAQRVAVPLLRVSPLQIGFGDRMIGTGTPSQRVTVTNDGGAPATLAPLGITLDFTIENTSCGQTLAPASSCFADVSFRPLGFGPRSGTLTVNGNDAGSPHTVSLGGAGCRPFIFGRGSSCTP